VHGSNVHFFVTDAGVRQGRDFGSEDPMGCRRRYVRLLVSFHQGPWKRFENLLILIPASIVICASHMYEASTGRVRSVSGQRIETRKCTLDIA
jgi:hypothetical protein